MSEPRVEMRNGKMVTVDGYTCQVCGTWGPYGELHTWLFCQLHKAGFDRETIIANVKYTANAMAE